MRPILVSLSAVFALISCAEPQTALTPAQWGVSDNPSEVEAARVQRSWEDAQADVQSRRDRLDRNKNLSEDQRNDVTRRIDQAEAEVNDPNLTPGSL